MAKRIMILCASPRRNGNTHALADWVIEGAKAVGAEVEKIDLTKLKYRNTGCISCYGCQEWEKYECVVHDEATPVLARIPEADVLVLATPVYFFGPSAQLKVFLDRAYSLSKFDLAKGDFTHPFKKGMTIALIASGGGDTDSGLKLVEDTYRTFATFIGGEFKSLLVPGAPHEPGEILRNAELKREAIAFGRGLAA